jgi:hypothetical protein
MFAHLVTFVGGPRDGIRTTIPSDTPAPPEKFYVASDPVFPAGPQDGPMKFRRAIYQHDTTRCGIYDFVGFQ